MKPSIITKANTALYTRIAAGIGGFLAAAISLGLSLYETREAGVVPKIEVGKPVDASRWKVTLQSGGLATEMPDGSKIAPGKKALIVNLTLENLSASSSNTYRHALKLENLPDAPAAQFYLVRDRALLWDLQPMMPEAVKVAWLVPEAQPLPKVLQVAVIGAIFKRMDNLYAAPNWFPTEKVAEVSLPLAQGAGAAP